MDPWSAETPVGNGDFFDVIFDVLRRTVLDAVKTIHSHSIGRGSTCLTIKTLRLSMRIR